MVENTYFPDFTGKVETTEGETRSSCSGTPSGGADSNNVSTALNTEQLDEECSTDEDTATFASSLKSSLLPKALQQARSLSMSLGSSIGSSDSNSDGAWEDVSDSSSFSGSYTSGSADESDDIQPSKMDDGEHKERTSKSSGSRSNGLQLDITNLDREPIDNRASCSDHGFILRHVDYVHNLDVASTNKEISEVKPIGASEAREAFDQEVPHIVPIVSKQEKLGTIDYFRGHFRKEPVVLHLSIDEERGIRTPETSVKQTAEASHDEVCQSPRKRSSTEIFFIVLISLSLFTLFILLIVVATK